MWAPVQPSEDETKVLQAVTAIFPDASVTRQEGGWAGTASGLEEFGKLVRRQKILDATRRTLLAGLDESGSRSIFLLNKQAALRGRISYSRDLDAPLGDIEVVVDGADVESHLKEIAPMTVKGLVVSEEEAEAIVNARRKEEDA